jgi:hypothetical protein
MELRQLLNWIVRLMLEIIAFLPTFVQWILRRRSHF